MEEEVDFSVSTIQPSFVVRLKKYLDFGSRFDPIWFKVLVLPF